MTNLIPKTERKRGRPYDSTKSESDRIRDRVRTVLTLNELLRRSPANNVNQFAQWFDQAMRALHPGRPWETAMNNKWRKNFSGICSMTKEAVEWLHEIFPDHRYYNEGGCAFPMKADDLVSSAQKLFLEGPARNWKALWGDGAALKELRRGYAIDDSRWSDGGGYRDISDDLQIKVFCSFDFDEKIDEEDFGRAVVLLRGGDWGGIAQPEDRVDAYLCTKAALASVGIKYAALGVLHEIDDYLAINELERIESDWRYRKAIKQQWAGQRMLGERCLLEYVYNPFIHLIERSPSSPSARRWETIAALTHGNFSNSNTYKARIY